MQRWSPTAGSAARHAFWHQLISNALTPLLRRALLIALLVYGVFLVTHPDNYGLLDSADLPIHETGHLIFAPFGEFMQFAGGTLFQLIVPIVFVAYFWKRDRFAAGVVLFWVAQNCWNISRYIADARAQELPLVGGGEHDWAYLLGRHHWIDHDQGIASVVRLIGVAIFGYGLWVGWRASSAPPQTEAPAT